MHAARNKHCVVVVCHGRIPRGKKRHALSPSDRLGPCPSPRGKVVSLFNARTPMHARTSQVPLWAVFRLCGKRGGGLVRMGECWLGPLRS